MINKQVSNVIESILTDYGIWEYLKEFNPLIAGGSIADLLRSSVYSVNELELNRVIKGDIDVYVPFIEDKENTNYNVIFDYLISNHGKYEVVYSNNFQIILQYNQDYPPINIVLMKDTQGNPVNTMNIEYSINKLRNFDLTCVQCGVYYEKGKPIYLINNSSITDIYRKVVNITDNRFITDSSEFLLIRVWKYCNKGFKVSKDTIAKLKYALSRDHISLTDIYDPSRSTNNLHETEEYTKSSDTFIEFYREFCGRPYSDIIDKILDHGE